MAEKKKILYIVEAMGGGVFTYIVDLANELVNKYDMYIAYAVRKQTPKNYKDYFDKRIHLIEVTCMKKILSLILTLFCVLSLVGCGRSMDDIIKNESSITGVVEEVYNNSILISIQTDAYPYGAYCDVSLDAENKDDMVDFNIGDEVIVYYDGNIAESYPLQINTVYAISLKDPAN